MTTPGNWLASGLPKDDEPEAEPVPQPAENAAYVNEYQSQPAYSKVMTQAEYVAMRRIDDGRDLLVPVQAGTW